MRLSLLSRGARLTFAALTIALNLSGCGGDDGSPASNSNTGTFSDSLVEGLTYTSGDKTGKTDASGAYQYEPGKTVTFKVGDITLGTVTPKAWLTPVSLVNDAMDETNETVTNIAKFLQSIDDDNNPSNGIKISEAADAAARGKSINFAQSAAAFDADASIKSTMAAIMAATSAGIHAPVSNAQAQSHLKANLLARLAGNYSGTYSGTSSGTFNVTISGTGAISGSGLNNGESFTISGTVASSGKANFTSGVAGGATFQGGIAADTGTLAGTWQSNIGSGTYSGKKM